MKTKKTKFGLTLMLALACVCAAFGFVGCKKVTPPAEHEHNYTEWRYSDTEHWRECPDDGAATEKSPHEFTNGQCECGFVDPREFGTVTGKVTLYGGKNVADYSGVTVDFEGDDAVVTFDANGNFTATHVTVGKAYDVTVSKEGYFSSTAAVRLDTKDETVALVKPFALVYQRFEAWQNRNLANFDLLHMNDAAKPYIASVAAGDLGVISRDSYGDVAMSVWMKQGNNTGAPYPNKGVLIKFGEGEDYMILRIQKDGSDYWLRWDGALPWQLSGQSQSTPTIEGSQKWICKLDDTQRQTYASDAGIKLTAVRKGNVLYAFLGDQYMSGTAPYVGNGVRVLSQEYADDKVRVGFWEMSALKEKRWNFEVTEDISAYEAALPSHSATASAAEHGTVAFDKTTYLYGETATVTVTPDNGYILSSLTVNDTHVELEVADNAYSFTVTQNSTASATFRSADTIDSVAFSLSADANANGKQITLYRDGETDIVGTVANNMFTAANVKPGRWHVKTTQYGVEFALKDVWVGSNSVSVDTSGAFKTATAVNIGNEKTHDSGAGDMFYSVPANIVGDAYFAMKVKSSTDTSSMTNDAARFGLHMMYAGNKELGITFVVKGGNWVLQTNGAVYEQRTVVYALREAMKTEDGIYMAVHRESVTGNVHVYLGPSMENLTELTAFTSDAITAITKNAIVQFGVDFRSGAYAATVSGLLYGTTMADAFGVEYERKNVAVTVNGVTPGGESASLTGTVTLTNVMDSTDTHTVSLISGVATVNGLFTPGTYNVVSSNADYCERLLTLVKGDATAIVTLQYKRFDAWAHGNLDRLDTSHMNDAVTNDATPYVKTVTAGDLGVITRDSYSGNVAVSVQLMSKNNSGDKWPHSGLIVQFKDGAQMILRLHNYNDNGSYHGQQWLCWNKTGSTWNQTTLLNSDKWANQKITDDQASKFNSDQGVKLTLVRKGNKLYVALDGTFVNELTMTLDAKYTDSEVKVGFWEFNPQANKEWKFEITTDLSGFTGLPD